MNVPVVRKGQTGVALTREEFGRRLRQRFDDPAFRSVDSQIDAIVAVAWRAYYEYRKSPRTRKAGPGFADPDFDLPVEWLEARDRIQQAARQQKESSPPSRILLVCGAARTDQSCPGEMSKTCRLVQMACEDIEKAGAACDVLDLSVLTAEYGRQILPCKACVSTAMPLCHWPCSCYPNHALGQVNDWMNELYPRWVAAHGVMIVTPVYWYQSPSVLKLMIDRLVCADGLDRYVGYYEPYATSHEALDRDEALQPEVRNAARALVEAVGLSRQGQLPDPGRGLPDPRPK